MPDKAEIEEKFWKALKSDMTCMLGLSGEAENEGQPMTAQLEDKGAGPVWFFTSSETDLVRALGGEAEAFIHFADKGHHLFAALSGRLVEDNDRATIDRLWNPFVAAWFEDGKDDPKLRLLRFDAREGKVWLNENNLFAATKLLLGSDPKKDYQDKVAEIRPGLT